MKKSSSIAVIIATFILLSGIIIGLSDIKINLKIMHSIIGFGFIIIVAFGLKIHYYRLIHKSPTDLISWIHFIIFSLLLLISIRALRAWYFIKKEKKDKKENNENENHSNHNH